MDLRNSPRFAFDYDLFISYRRRDGATCALWLKNKLESYRPPAGLHDSGFKAIRPFLDTSYPRAVAASWWEENIKSELQRARYLLLILTPEILRESQSGEED